MFVHIIPTILSVCAFAFVLSVCSELVHASHVVVYIVCVCVCVQIATAVSSQTEEHMLVEPSPDTPDHQLHAVTDTMAALGE